MTKFQTDLFRVTTLAFLSGIAFVLVFIGMIKSIWLLIVALIAIVLILQRLAIFTARMENTWDKLSVKKAMFPKIRKKQPDGKKYSFDDAQTMYQNLVELYNKAPGAAGVLRTGVECANVLKTLLNNMHKDARREAVTDYLIDTYRMCGLDMTHLMEVEDSL